MSNFLELKTIFENLQLNDKRYIDLLSKLIGEAENLQNNPAQGHVPQENLASDHILTLLDPFLKKNGGVLELDRIEYVKGRGNVIIKYPGTTENTVAFVGCHLDVVPADPETWERNPFELNQEGDFLYGRGTTDCLGHVALITELLCNLAETKPILKNNIIVVFICNEENSSETGIGVDQLMTDGHLKELSNGPIFWVDSADSQPCIGTAGIIQWAAKFHGKLFHSGLPHKGINAIEMAMEGIGEIQKLFYKDFAAHEMEEKYNYITSSTMKPTQIECSRGSLNQIPPHCTVSGDMRVTPFYDVHDVKKAVDGYVADLNNNLGKIPTRGPYSKYEVEDAKGKIEWEWLGEAENGIACDLNSKGNQALYKATEEILGTAKPFAINGSLPLVRYLQDNGFDVQIVGYGLSARYHADNEYCDIKDMRHAIKILSRTILNMEK